MKFWQCGGTSTALKETVGRQYGYSREAGLEIADRRKKAGQERPGEARRLLSIDWL